MALRSHLLVAFVAVFLAAVAANPLPQPQPLAEAGDEPAPDSLRDRELIVQSLEDDIARTAFLASAARAVRQQQVFENDILRETVATLFRDRGDPARLQRDLQELRELVKRDKRQVEVLSDALRSERVQRQVDGGASASASAGSDSGSILSLLPSLLGGSSGGNGGDDDDDDYNDDDDDLNSATNGGGGGSDSGSILQLLPAVLGSSSGGNTDGGQGSNVLSLLTGVLGASSGGTTDTSGSAGSSAGKGFFANLVLNKVAPTGPTPSPVPGSYDDLIGKGITGYDPVAVFSNNLGGAIRTKFSVFNSLFSLLTGVFGALGGGSGGGGITASASLTKTT